MSYYIFTILKLNLFKSIIILVDYIFKDIFEQFLKVQSTTCLTKKRKIMASKHFLPAFGNKNIRNITKDQIENYQLKRKLEILSFSVPSGHINDFIFDPLF